MNGKVAIEIVCALTLNARSFAEVQPDTDAEKIARIALQSSTIASAGYSRKTRILEIEFRSGSIYRYRDVPLSVSAAFDAAQSKGKFFSAEIRGKFAFEKVRGTKR